jgi:hypothetical protein
MVSNEERRNIVARLRDYDNLRESLREAPIGAFLDALGVDGYMNWRGVCNLLADLIEPEPERTCHVEEVGVVDESGYYLSGITRDKCSNCGFVDDTQMWAEVYDYCPKCGAKRVN